MIAVNVGCKQSETESRSSRFSFYVVKFISFASVATRKFYTKKRKNYGYDEEDCCLSLQTGELSGLRAAPPACKLEKLHFNSRYMEFWAVRTGKTPSHFLVFGAFLQERVKSSVVFPVQSSRKGESEQIKCSFSSSECRLQVSKQQSYCMMNHENCKI